MSQNKHARLFYEEIRNRKDDVTSIAANTGFSAQDINTVKQHIFYKEHALGEETPTRFDPDYDMAVFWQRLIEGKAIQEMDIVLVQHELEESRLMHENNFSYFEAHKTAEEKYNYKRYIDELDRKEGVK